MIPESDFLRSMHSKYDVVGFFDLADVNQKTSSIYRIFRDNYKTAYRSDERLIFYSRDRPSADLLAHIQKAANRIDISNSFILICCPYDCSSDLKIANQQFGNPEDDHIKTEIADMESKPLLDDRFLIDDSNLCPMPWTHLSVDNDGTYHACCLYRGDLGSAHHQSFKEIFYSDKMQSIRDSFLKNERISECKDCWVLDDAGLKSNRANHMNLYHREFFAEWIDDPKIRTLDLRPGNTCNFACRICDTNASSKIAAEQLKFETDPLKKKMLKIQSREKQWFDKLESFNDEIYSMLPDIINLDFYGGEPFLQKNLYPLLEKIVNLGHASHIRLHINTNGSVYPKNYLPLLKQFREVDIAVSIDDIEGRFEIQRSNGIWTEVEANIKNMLESVDDKFHVYLMPTINIQNIFYIEELYTWAAKQGIKIRLNFLHSPQYLSVDYMTEKAKNLVIQKYQNHSNPELANLAERVRKSPGGDGKEFVESMRRFDSRRNQDFRSTHYDIASAMGYL